MCLSTVYNQEKEVLARNVAAVKAEKGRLVFTDIMGISTAVSGTIEKVDLIDNQIFVVQNQAERPA